MDYAGVVFKLYANYADVEIRSSKINAGVPENYAGVENARLRQIICTRRTHGSDAG